MVFEGFWAIPGIFLTQPGQVTPESLEERSMTLELDALDALGIVNAQVGVGGCWRADGGCGMRETWFFRFFSMFFSDRSLIFLMVFSCYCDTFVPLRSKTFLLGWNSEIWTVKAWIVDTFGRRSAQ